MYYADNPAMLALSMIEDAKLYLEEQEYEWSCQAAYNALIYLFKSYLRERNIAAEQAYSIRALLELAEEKGYDLGPFTDYVYYDYLFTLAPRDEADIPIPPCEPFNADDSKQIIEAAQNLWRLLSTADGEKHD